MTALKPNWNPSVQPPARAPEIVVIGISRRVVSKLRQNRQEPAAARCRLLFPQGTAMDKVKNGFAIGTGQEKRGTRDIGMEWAGVPTTERRWRAVAKAVGRGYEDVFPQEKAA